MAKLPKSKAIERLERALDAIPELQSASRLTSSVEFEKWCRDTEVAISNTFGDETRHIKDFTSVRYWPMLIAGYGTTDYRKPYVEGLTSASSVLQSMIDEIREYWEDDDGPDTDTGYETGVQLDSNEVFIVHGRDDGPKQAVARFLERLELSPIILHEQPNQGQTIIEKFESIRKLDSQ